jgi:hypothetical protein
LENGSTSDPGDSVVGPVVSRGGISAFGEAMGRTGRPTVIACANRRDGGAFERQSGLDRRRAFDNDRAEAQDRKIAQALELFT